jgi:aquaporin Z
MTAIATAQPTTTDATSNARILGAEFFGTTVLILGGVGSAVLSGKALSGGGILAQALAFGLTLVVITYAIGHVSGAHVNPAVTLAMIIARKVKPATAPFYILGQLLGAALGAIIVWSIANGTNAFSAKNNFAANGFSRWSPGGYGSGSAIIVEIIFTALLVFVVLSSTGRRFPKAGSGLAVGLTYTVIHLATMTIDGTGVNPARSMASALFSGTEAWKQIWLFIVFPLVGSVVGVLAWLFIDDARLEDTMLNSGMLEKIRDEADRGIDGAIAKAEQISPLH